MDRCRYRGEAADERKMEDPSPFLMREAFPRGHGAATLPYILCYNKGNATWAAVASKEGKDET